MPMPVLPLVGSIKVSPGLMRPFFCASSTMRLPMRSFTEPPALRYSHFARYSQPVFLPMLRSRTSGVLPIDSSTDDWISCTVELLEGRARQGAPDEGALVFRATRFRATRAGARMRARMPQETLVFQLAPAAQARLERELQGGDFERRAVEHARFSVRGEGVVATLYRSGKLVLQGSEVRTFAARYLP